MTRRAGAAAVAAVLWSSAGVSARAQSISMELDATAGFSTEGNTAAAGAQLRIFGDLVAPLSRQRRDDLGRPLGRRL